MANNNILIHEKIKALSQPQWRTIDMTAGNGHDTLLLAQISKQVYSLDIQKEALDKTKELTKNYTNIIYILDDHQNVNHYVEPYVDLVIFNLGYLPGGNKNIKTKAETTLISLSKVHQLLKINSYLVVTCYPGHKGGLSETKAVSQWMNHQKQKQIYDIEVLDYPTKNSPITYFCKKKAM